MDHLSLRDVKYTKITQLVGAEPEAGDLQLFSAVLFSLWKYRLSFKFLYSFSENK